MKKLYKSNTNVKVAGVCGGIAEYLNVDPTIVRLVTIVASLFSAGMGIFAYIVCAVVIPAAPRDDSRTENTDNYN